MNSRLVFATLALAVAGQMGEQRPVIASVDVNGIGLPVVLDAVNDVAYVGAIQGNWSLIQTVNVSGNVPELIATVQLFEENAVATAMTRMGNRLMTTLSGDSASYLAVVDASLYDDPVLESYVELTASSAPTSIAAMGSYAYITAAPALLIYDVSVNPPTLAASLTLECELTYATIHNGVLYVACGEAFLPYDLSNPTVPVVGTAQETVGVAKSLAGYEETLFAASVEASNNGTAFLDHYLVADGVPPVHIATYSFAASDVPSFTVATVNGTAYAFLACGSEGLRILNLQAEDKDAAVTGYVRVNSETSGQVAVKDDLLFAADAPNRFIIVDTLDIVQDDDDDDGPSAAVIAVAVIVPVACIAGLAGGYFYYKSKTAAVGSYSSMA